MQPSELGYAFAYVFACVFFFF